MAATNGPPVRHYKLVLLGDASVGKSCLVVRFAKGDFSEYQEPTIGAAFMTQSVKLSEQTTIKFEIWDTAGQERYRSLAPMYYRGASAAVIVYDISSRESFDGAKSWVHELQGVNRNDDLVIALAGNKADLADSDRDVDPEVARAYAQDMGIFFMETSAKTGQNVKDIFEEIARRLPKVSKEEGGANKFQVGNNSRTISGTCCWSST
eukprot:GEMP01032218.1.p1 GENE.GEMP01032218.1~~GEMP01032218.1.p1  ORF type:complete len:207 (+),score=40.67 GEMP01032218.1:53-673(+)